MLKLEGWQDNQAIDLCPIPQFFQTMPSCCFKMNSCPIVETVQSTYQSRFVTS